MRRVLATLFALLMVAPTMAADADKPAGAPGTNIDMPFLMAPMNGADGKLAAYAYIASRLTTNSDASANNVRDKIAFIQDVFVRDVNNASITKPDDPTKVDTAGLQARLLADARKIVAGNSVVSIAIVQVQIAPLRAPPGPGTPPPEDSAAKTPAPAQAAPAK